MNLGKAALDDIQRAEDERVVTALTRAGWPEPPEQQPPVFVSAQVYADLQALVSAPLRGHYMRNFKAPKLDANAQVERLRARRELKAGTRRHRAASKLLTALETEIARMERSGKSHATTVAEAKSGATQAKNAQLEAEKHITMWREVLA